MTIDEIKELIHVVQETGVAELEVQRGENRVRIRSTSTSAVADVSSAIANVATVPSASVNVPATVAESRLRELPTIAEDERNQLVKSPIVGTYYDSPAPGAAVFVKVGEHVEAKQVLCIIESMKLMNEIEAEIAGVIVAKHVENGRPVEYGEALFTIRAS